MKVIRQLAGVLVIALYLLAAGCTEQALNDPYIGVKRPDEAFLKYGEEFTDIVELFKINDSVWVHTSYDEISGVLTPHNGLVVVTDQGLVLIDAPWTKKQMDSLEKLALQHFNSGFADAIITDAEPDQMDGIYCLADKGIRVTCLERVAGKADKLGCEPDTVLEGDEASVTCGDTDFEIYYPGECCSDDCTIVWIGKYNLLFAGDFVKEYGAHSLGQSGKAGSRTWPESLNNILSHYDNIEIVVPGHGQWGDATLIDYTLGLFEE